MSARASSWTKRPLPLPMTYTCAPYRSLRRHVTSEMVGSVICPEGPNKPTGSSCRHSTLASSRRLARGALGVIIALACSRASAGHMRHFEDYRTVPEVGLMLSTPAPVPCLPPGAHPIDGQQDRAFCEEFRRTRTAELLCGRILGLQAVHDERRWTSAQTESFEGCIDEFLPGYREANNTRSPYSATPITPSTP